MTNASSVTLNDQVRRILRRPDVEKKTGFKRSQIYKLMQDGAFPKAIPLSQRALGWDSDEIEAWIEARRQLRA